MRPSVFHPCLVTKALKNDMATLVRVSRKQLARAEVLGMALDIRQEKESKTLGDAPWSPDEDWRKDFKSVNETLATAGQSLIRGLEGNKKNLSNVPTEQLEAQFKAELEKAAAMFSPEEWARLDKIRMDAIIGKGKK